MTLSGAIYTVNFSAKYTAKSLALVDAIDISVDETRINVFLLYMKSLYLLLKKHAKFGNTLSEICYYNAFLNKNNN